MGESKSKTTSTTGPVFSESKLERGLEINIDIEGLDQEHELTLGIPEPGALLGNKYRVERLIARGGMGAVYAATHIVSGKRVAVKWMLPALGQIKGARERFIREACATARIAHPNIVDIYDVGSDAGSVYLVMEYLRGETLSQRLSRTSLTEEEAIALLLPALRGVAAAHANGVVHRDLKPDNVFLCCNEAGEALEPKVLDFGISKITSDEVRDLALTHSGAVLGTPYYMSPEQVRGARDVDARADVYAFGVMLFEALTGQRPFDADTYNELILKIATEPPPSAADLNPALHPELIAVVERAMARDPDERFQTIEALALALEPFAGGVRFKLARTLVDPIVLASDFASTPLPTGTSKLSVRTPTPLRVTPPAPPDAPKPARMRVVAATLVVGLCAGFAIYGLSHRGQERAPLARPAPPVAAAPAAAVAEPARAEVAPATPAAAETSVLAARVHVEPQLNAKSPSSAPAPASSNARASSPAKPSAPKRPASPSVREKRWISDPPAPESLAAPVTVRRLPKDWDDRLSTDTARMAAPSDVPAGKIDAQDFR